MLRPMSHREQSEMLDAEQKLPRRTRKADERTFDVGRSRDQV